MERKQKRQINMEAQKETRSELNKGREIMGEKHEQRGGKNKRFRVKKKTSCFVMNFGHSYF